MSDTSPFVTRVGEEKAASEPYDWGSLKPVRTQCGALICCGILINVVLTLTAVVIGSVLLIYVTREGVAVKSLAAAEISGADAIAQLAAAVAGLLVSGNHTTRQA